MRLKILSITLLLSSLFLARVAAVGVPPADVAGRQIIDHIYVVNGLPVQDLMIEAEWSERPNGQPQGNLMVISRDKLFFKQPNKLRADSMVVDPGGPMDGKLRTIIRDGVNSWMFISMAPYPVKKKEDEHSASLLLPPFLQRYPEDSNKEYKVVGKESIGGVATQMVRVVHPGMPQDVLTAWVDTTRWVPLKIEHQVPGEKQGEPAIVKTVLYKDIRQYKDGRWFPFHLEIYINGALKTVGVYKALSVNSGLQDSLFEPMNKFIK